MRDTGVLIALVLGTFGAGVLTWYAWHDRHVYPILGKMIYTVYAMLLFCWVAFGWMWFSV